jgi:3-oxoacyl-[acyl-carrier-protein] synthase-3
MGHFWPETEIDNEFFNSLDIGSDSAWIEERVGIKTRRSVLSREQIQRIRRGEISGQKLLLDGAVMSVVSMSEKAWQVARTRAGIITDAIDTVVSGASVPDHDIPASACTIASAIGLERIRGFDINSACSTFVVQCHVIRSMMMSGMTKEAAIFCTDRYTTRVDYSDKRNSILFGDASIAAIGSSTPKPGALKVIDTMVESSPAGCEHIIMPVGRNFHQNGAAVQKFAVTKTIAAAQDILVRNNLTTSDASWFIGHQANYRMLASAIEKMGVDSKRHLFNVSDKGNQGACGAPSVLSQNWDLYKPGDYIVVAVVGSGLTWASMLLQKQ